MNYLTIKEVALKYGVQRSTAQKWIEKGSFPNAVQEEHPPFPPIWKIPESDLKTFVKPRAGNPHRKEDKAA